MNKETRTISYIDHNEDLLDSEIALALEKSMSQNLTDYCKLVRMLHAMFSIDTLNHKPDKSIYYIEDEY